MLRLSLICLMFVSPAWADLEESCAYPVGTGPGEYCVGYFAGAVEQAGYTCNGLDAGTIGYMTMDMLNEQPAIRREISKTEPLEIVRTAMYVRFRGACD